MKIGLDLHGIVDTCPEFFGELTRLFVAAGHEIHISTGSHIKEGRVEEKLKEMGIHYTHLFSIADYHKEKGTVMSYDKEHMPWIKDEDWNKTKGDYCKEHGIDIHIDDTKRYANYFSTPFLFAGLVKQYGADKVPKKGDSIVMVKNLNPIIRKGMWGTIVDIIDDEQIVIEYAMRDGELLAYNGDTRLIVRREFIDIRSSIDE